MKKPDAWRYQEFSATGELRINHIWSFLPANLSYLDKFRGDRKIIITPLFADELKSVTIDSTNKYDSKKLVEAYNGH